MGKLQGRMFHMNVNDPADLKKLTVSGAIWATPYAQKGIDLVNSGKVKLADLQDVPDHIRAALSK